MRFMSKTPDWTPAEIEALTTQSKPLWDRFVRDHAGVIFAAVQRKLIPAGF